MWKTAVFSKARNCFYLNLVQLNYVNWFVHLDLTAPDRLFSNFINYQKKKKMLLLIRRLKQPIPHGFTRTQTTPAAYGLSWCYSASVLLETFHTGRSRHWKAILPVKAVIAIKFINFTGDKSTCPRHVPAAAPTAHPCQAPAPHGVTRGCITPGTQHCIVEAFPKNVPRNIPLFIAQKPARWSLPRSPSFTFFLN